ncbi:GM14239 [Drosophila sechellia]|uniref:GM14239 n=1 Tax=Drosophila sechellia TaxID=7238 RepID=B4HVM8_DROSE|nr:GM14239 [Drosophila sechellia]
MDTHATWVERAGSEVGGRVSGVRQQRTLDIGNLQRTRKSCQWGAGQQERAAGIPGHQELFLFSCKQSSVQLRRLSLLASAAAASAERGSPLGEPPTTPF